MSRALNRTLKGVKTDISANVRTVLNASKKAVDENITIEKATSKDVYGAIRIKGKIISMSEFSPKQTNKGVKVAEYV